MKKRAIVNFAAAMSYQVLNLLVGLLIPKYYTEVFGSIYNGLNSSVSQVLSLLSVLQFGISAVSIQQMFRYIASGDTQMITAIYDETAKQYRRMGWIFLAVVIPLIGLFPLLVRDDLPYYIIVVFLLFRSIGSAMDYFFQAKYGVILAADNKSYIIYAINIVLLLIGTALHLLVLFTVKHIILYQAVAVLLTFIRLGLVSTYVRKNYPYLCSPTTKTYTPPENGKRRDVLVSEIAGMVIDSTDLLVLTTFSGLVNASIYSVYNFVVTGLGSVLSSCREAVFAGMGKTYFQDVDEYRRKMDRFESVYLFLVFSLYSTCIVLFRPFVEVYTAKMDADYVSVYFPILFILARMLVNFRIPAIVAINTAGHFKQVKRYAVTEAVINLVLSVVFVHFWGIYGVLIGTIAGAAYRTPILIAYAGRHILYRSAVSYWGKILRWIPLFALSFIVSLVFPFHFSSLLKWCGFAVVFATMMLGICLLWTALIDRETFNELKRTAIRLIKDNTLFS